MKALSNHLKLNISRRFRNRRIVFEEIFVPSANSFNTLVLWCTWLKTYDINRNKKCSFFHLCLVASIFNVWLLWFWYWSSCSNIHVRVSTKRKFFPLDHLMSQNLIWILPKNKKYPSFWKLISIMSVHVSSRLIILLSVVGNFFSFCR